MYCGRGGRYSPLKVVGYRPLSYFLDASSHLYMRVCPSIGPSVRPLVRPSVRPRVTLLSKTGKSMKNGLLRIVNDLEGAGRGRKRDEEEGVLRRKEGLGGRRDEEEGGTRRKDRRGGRRELEEGPTRRKETRRKDRRG